ncbi:hypothetical protein CHARACLAT_004433 [Characodon lateralis]|uniref:Secreted protein n=1 Tax=Characodon lateralis TaxID=208331 RepID=A0ABU7CVD7_9TELE|nr:hypothetical protein [Characodon lateralis]
MLSGDLEMFSWLALVFSCSSLMTDMVVPSERQIIIVKQRPCSVSVRGDAGTYIEFCGLPEKLGGSSNNDDSNNSNNRAHHIPKHKHYGKYLKPPMVLFKLTPCRRTNTQSSLH